MNRDHDPDTMNQLSHLTNDQLLEAWVVAAGELDKWQDRVGRIEWMLQRKMEADGATEFVSPAGTAEIKTSTSYDHSKLTPILELVHSFDLIEAGAYTPEMEKIVEVPASWNVTKLKPFGKRGRAVDAVIEAAKVPGKTRLVIKAAETRDA